MTKQETKEYKQLYYLANKETIKERARLYKEQNKEHCKEYEIEYRKNNPDKLKDWRKDNIDHVKQYKKDYKQKNKTHRNEQLRQRKLVDPLFKLSCDIRRTIADSFKQSFYTKNSKTYQILGCSLEEFKQHLESKFEHWMTWDNRAKYNGTLNHGWDIDHIIPLDSAESIEDIIRLNHYTNLQPLCSYTNRDLKRNLLNFTSSTA